MAKAIHRFLGFELDERRFELRCDGSVVATTPRVFGLIAYLMNHRDRVVGKQELIREVWRAKVASDTAISQVVMLARRALRDEGEEHRIIKTVRGRGFRFIAAVDSAEIAAPTLEAASPAATPSDAWVGRNAELKTLLDSVSHLLQNRSSLLWVEGEPGIGKTSLVSALAREASERNISVHWGRAWEGGGASPFWPFIHLLRGMAQREGLPAMRRFMGRGESELLSLMPEWAKDDAVAALDTSTARARFRVFDAISRFLRNACRSGGPDGARPRLIILDDLHAADDASIELVRFLATELPEIPLSIVATARDFELATNPTLARLADSIDPSHRIRLGGLSDEEVSALVTQRVGRSATTRVLQSLRQASGGNPLLLGEMCRHVGPAGLDGVLDPSVLANMSLPDRITSAVHKLLSELPPVTTHVLSVASVLGREFSLPLLAALCEITEVELIERLAPAMTRGLLRPASAGEQRTFSHALVHTAIYAELADPFRLTLHRRIAELLESQSTHEKKPPLFEIAHHYHRAAALGCRQEALEYAQRAAKHAADITAFELAASLYDRAHTLAETEASSASTRHELLCNAGAAWLKAGHLTLALERFDRAAAEARADRHAERFATAVLGAANASRMQLLHDRGRHKQLLQALSMLPDGDSELRACVLGASAVNLRGREHFPARDAMTRAAVEMAERLGNDTALLRTLTLRHVALWGMVHPRAMLETVDRIVELGIRANDREQLLDALMFRTFHHVELGDLAGFWSAFEKFGREIENQGSPWHGYVVSAIAPVVASTRGDFAGAEQLSELALRQGLSLRDPFAAAAHAVRSLFLRLERGVRHLPPAAAATTEPPAFVPEDYHAFWALWWVNAGQRSRAAQAVRRLLSHDWDYVVADALRRPLLAAAGQVSAALGDRDALAAIYDNLLPDAGLHLILPVGASMGPVSHHLGTVAAALGREEAADLHFQQAIEETSPRSPWHVRSQAEYGRLLSSRGIPRGRELLVEAAAIAEEYGMRDLQDDIQRAMPLHSPFATGLRQSSLKSPPPTRH